MSVNCENVRAMPTPPALHDAEQRVMNEVPEVLEWQVPAHGDLGPILVQAAVPTLRIVDSAGRYILVTPQQAAVLADKIERAHDWMLELADD